MNDEQRHSYYELQDKLISKILGQLENVVERIHQAETSTALNTQKLREVERDLKSIREELQTLRKLREESMTDFEVLKNKVAWIVAIAGFLLLAFWDDIQQLWGRLK